VDVSQKLIAIAKNKYGSEKATFQKISSSGMLPFPDNFFNCTVSISVFHHFPVGHAQMMAKEIYRVTKPDGVIIISVWNLWQKKYLRYIFNPRIIWKKFFCLGECSKFGMREIVIPFKNNQGEVFERYHYVFRKNELANIFRKVGFSIEKSFILDKKNVVIIGRKKV
jgi:ubiquinone/menaquinone biosynthesis C-methylase UbiE